MTATTVSGEAMEHPSQIMHLIYAHTGMRNRVEALIRAQLWDGETDPTIPIPVDSIAWAVATNPTILATVTAAIEAGNPYAAVDMILESDLVFVVLSAFERLQALTPVTPEPEPGA